MRRIRSLTLIGTIAGIIFGLLLKGIQAVTHKKVYILLLNIDYIPILGNVKFNELIEFSFHLIVSIILVCVLYYGLKKANLHKRISYYVGINIGVAILLYFTTSFSERTPELMDIVALTYWVLAHAVFGFIVGWLIKYKMSI